MPEKHIQPILSSDGALNLDFYRFWATVCRPLGIYSCVWVEWPCQSGRQSSAVAVWFVILCVFPPEGELLPWSEDVWCIINQSWWERDGDLRFTWCFQGAFGNLYYFFFKMLTKNLWDNQSYYLRTLHVIIILKTTHNLLENFCVAISLFNFFFLVLVVLSFYILTIVRS